MRTQDRAAQGLLTRSCSPMAEGARRPISALIDHQHSVPSAATSPNSPASHACAPSPAPSAAAAAAAVHDPARSARPPDARWLGTPCRKAAGSRGGQVCGMCSAGCWSEMRTSNARRLALCTACTLFVNIVLFPCCSRHSLHLPAFASFPRSPPPSPAGPAAQPPWPSAADSAQGLRAGRPIAGLAPLLLPPPLPLSSGPQVQAAQRARPRYWTGRWRLEAASHPAPSVGAGSCGPGVGRSVGTGGDSSMRQVC